MSEVNLIGQYDLIKAKITALKAEDIAKDPAKVELLKQLEQTIEELGKLYNI